MTVEVDRDSYDSEVIQSDKPVLVDFWGPRCGPCLALMPSVEELEKEYAGRLKVAKVNTAENRMLCARLRVMALPAFLFYKDGAEVARLNGDKITVGEIKKAVDAMLG